MKPLSSCITHLYHSGFSIETLHHFLVFDYVEPTGEMLTKPIAGSLDFNQLARRDNVYFFITHHHQDHFMPQLFDYQESNPAVQIIAGDGVPLPARENCHLMKPHEKLQINEVSVESFGSTDAGVSFYVQTDHLSFFHAGDLNWWHWESFSPQQQLQEEKDFKEEIHRLKGKRIDVAFVPVDPRLGTAYHWAGTCFIETIKPSLFIPMHFANDFSVTRRFATQVADTESRVIVLNHRGQQIEYTKN
ncbi:MBL fold metallo-hydrolase [Anoxynatronum sibiricum]|uniref:MBL fold metallo-hydrolase n=1 Tax=Anoxynatronum sibiricum TaxID=210623 RepID=A0ABU9VRN7_9CLOT